ncbi:MAG: DUF1801 domain-containing protein [Cyclobacteriaceae bacterium]|nr:DUF1801 domain-containing protein [Cyclobacteriaceae bacterium]
MKINTIDEYIAAQPFEKKEMLKQLRDIIRSVVPKASEAISYMIPTYKQNGHLVGFGVNKKGCSFYCMNPKIAEQLPEEFKKLNWSASTIHFTMDQKLPVTIIKKIIRYRVKENQERVLSKL